MKVIVCGPPHSGKSVFVANLKAHLPRFGTFLFRAAPDGEGTWANKADQELVSRIRRKGQFDKTFMDYVLNGLANCSLPITLVDVGGVRSQENTEIFSACDAFIVLSSSDEELEAWHSYGTELGLECLALLHSRLEGEDSLESDGAHDPVSGTITGLERGSSIQSHLLSLVAQKVVGFAKSEFEVYEKECTMSDTTITINGLAATLGKEESTKVLPNGREVTGIDWEGNDLLAVDSHLRRLGLGHADHIVVDGPAPAWLVTAIVHGVHPAAASLTDPRLGTVPVGCNSPNGEGEGKNLTFKAWDRLNEAGPYVEVEVEVEGGTFDVADLATVTPPAIPGQNGVVLNGRMPNWLTTSMAMAYHATAKWVACYQPGVGATVCITHDPAMPLGTVIEL